MKPVRIIAWGNLGRRDDGVALVLAERLDRTYAGRDDVVVQQYHQLGPEIVDDLDDCCLALFVDAHAHAEGEDVTVGRVEPATSGGLDTHHCSPQTLLGLAAAMGLDVPEARLVGIRGHDWAFGDQLSESTHAAMIEAEQRVRAMVDSAVCSECSPSGVGFKS